MLGYLSLKPNSPLLLLIDNSLAHCSLITRISSCRTTHTSMCVYFFTFWINYVSPLSTLCMSELKCLSLYKARVCSKNQRHLVSIVITSQWPLCFRDKSSQPGRQGARCSLHCLLPPLGCTWVNFCFTIPASLALKDVIYYSAEWNQGQLGSMNDKDVYM